MVFSSLVFIFAFVPVFYLVYYMIPQTYKNAFLFLGSILFYTVGVLDTPVYIALFLLSIFINYVLGRLIQQGNRKKSILIGGLLYNFFWLFLFKYAAFLFSGINAVMGAMIPDFARNVSKLEFILPLGISFYTFQSVSYLLDVYRGTCQAEESFVTFGAYISMFPQLIAGPIVTYSGMREQLHSKRRFSIQNCSKGMKTFIAGLGLKVLLANQVGNLWSSITVIGFESISTPLAWLGIVAYSFQIYFDFFGYSLMAIGLGQMMGLSLPENFNHPYMSVSMTEFWRRWHITLGQWFREYIYIPLGGNRNGTVKTIRNIFIVWSFTGLWHGAAWNFVLWGVLLFVIMLIEKLGLKKILDKYRVVGHLYMILLIPLLWAIFAITDFSQMGIYFSKLFPFVQRGNTVVYGRDFVKYLLEFKYVLVAGILFSTPLPQKIMKRIQQTWLADVWYLIIFWGAIYCLYLGFNDPFMYFRF